MAESTKWDNVLPSVETALRYANAIEDWDESVAMRHEIIEYAYKDRGVPAKELGNLIREIYKEE